MSEEPCPHCGSTTRRIMYNKWHVREVYCGECFECLNQDDIIEQTRLAQQAAQEGRIIDFYMGTYKPDKESSNAKEPRDTNHANMKEQYLAMMLPKGMIYQSVFMAVFFAIWVVDSFLLRITTFIADPFPFWIPLIPAAIVFIPALYFMDASHKDLFDAGGFGLKTTGIFAKVRHPMYMGMLLAYLAIAISTLSLSSLLLFFLSFFLYNNLANYEEEQLEVRFGQEYVDYKQGIGKWVPKVT